MLTLLIIQFSSECMFNQYIDTYSFKFYIHFTRFELKWHCTRRQIVDKTAQTLFHQICHNAIALVKKSPTYLK